MGQVSIPDFRSQPDIRLVADQGADETIWLNKRKELITASDIFTWRGADLPKWWSGSRNEILAEKIHDTDRFANAKAETKRRVAWGRSAEELNRTVFETVLGLPVEATHGLFQNKRWDSIGATLDAVITPMQPNPLGKNDRDFVSFPVEFLELQQEIRASGQQWVCELKHSTHPYAIKKLMQEEDPAIYYISQIQTQMAITGLRRAVLVYGLGGCDLKFFRVKFDPEWLEILDDINDEFKQELEEYRSAA